MSVRSAKDPIKILQITDTHLYGVPGGTLLKMNTHQSLALVIDAIKKDENKIDLILATGDIAQDGSESAYNFFVKYMGALKVPFRWIPGNHDSQIIMQQVAADSEIGNKVEKYGNWQIILLDSSRVNHVHGYIKKKEMDFLDSALNEAEKDKGIDHCLVALHHNPVPGTSGWMKDIGLRNDHEFLELVQSHNIVRSVVYGHIHQELDYMIGKVRFFCTPSTCIQFKPEVIDFALDELNPGYRRIELYPDGRIESEVIRVSGQGLVADFSSAGY